MATTVSRGVCATLAARRSVKLLSSRQITPSIHRMAAPKAKVARRDFAMAATAGSFFDFSATSPAEGPDKPGSEVALSKYAGKVVLVENVATL